MMKEIEILNQGLEKKQITLKDCQAIIESGVVYHLYYKTEEQTSTSEQYKDGWYTQNLALSIYDAKRIGPLWLTIGDEEKRRVPFQIVNDFDFQPI